MLLSRSKRTKTNYSHKVNKNQSMDSDASEYNRTPNRSSMTSNKEPMVSKYLMI